MAALFTDKTLIVNNKDSDELELERELIRALENKVMLLYFGSADCPRCQEFAPILKEFFVRLTDEFYVERASQLVLVYVSLDETEEKQDTFLKTMPKHWLFLPFQDEFKRELELRFSVKDPPVVVVLKPNGEVIAANATEEIKQWGTACFQNWFEAAELVDRNFLLAQEFDNVALKSITDPIRRFKYKLKQKKRRKRSQEEEDDLFS
ncbi:nucleoredoxin-like protein 1 [Hemicordylus capensis]|uniref:nucleoredoxin-like protein 1 n=1 Tax=Hemicordylus capensis TaxID=884348 RepID=UPI00230297AB|nr:nucleoredoxin-like protein 1 [Hemicordylus capensis]XP_053155257.1 nucleoredoxin-like protein 1 [Hemicordylus capensis]XP_053155258.1 nucleoredoxin-like protein 1 [Hemicordylus capensis]XP_053155259.1 nucleoredoxin-like protein 1 [Hemicordylus capensis]XP_053155260.1 nucleoredoxin-like protein 1 [Hemicordylus capensis]